MAEYGAVNNANTDSPLQLNGLSGIGGGGLFPAGGVVSAINFYGGRINAGGTQYRLAIYQGGASGTDPTGATIQWDSGVLDGSVFSTADAWRTVSGLSITLAGGVRTWLVGKSDVAIRLTTALAADLGDLPLGFGYYLGTAAGMNSSTMTDAFPSSISAAYTSGGGSSNVKFSLTYAPAGGGSIAAFANYYRRMRSGK